MKSQTAFYLVTFCHHLCWAPRVQAVITTDVFVVMLVAYDFETVIPALDIAWKEIVTQYPETNFSRAMFRNPNSNYYDCDDFTSMISAYLARFYYKNLPENANLIIIPTGCSSAMVQAGDLSREWNVPMIASAGVNARLQNKIRFPTLVRLLPSLIRGYSRCLVNLLAFYNWTSTSIICDPDSSTDPFYGDLCKDIPETMKTYLLTTNTLKTDLSRKTLRATALRNARSRSKVIIILAHMDMVRRALITAVELGMMTGEFIYITSIYYNLNTSYCGSPNWIRNDSFDEIARIAFDSLLIVTLASAPKQSTSLKNFLNIIQTDYLPLNNVSVDVLYNEKQISAICANTALLAAAEMTHTAVTASASMDLSDGVRFSRNMYNRSFDSVTGLPFKVNANGDHESTYAVLGISQQSGEFEEIIFYDALLSSIYLSLLNQSTWVRQNSIPVDRPGCGFDGCDEEMIDNNNWKFYLSIVMPVTLAFTAGLFGLSRFVKNQRGTLNDDLWNLRTNQVFDIISSNQKLPASAPEYSLPHKSNTGSTLKIAAKNTKQILANGHVYVAWCKELQPLHHHQKFSLSKDQRKQITYRFDMNHPNVAMFYGVQIGSRSIKVLTEFAPKGSLNDVICQSDLRSNSTHELEYSFIHGITEGMKAIHASRLGCHGRLTTTTCLVDQRLSIRLTDFGLSELHQIVKNDVNCKNDYNWKSLYLAPEILSQATNSKLKTSKSADVYAFAVILHQLLFQCGPFGLDISCEFDGISFEFYGRFTRDMIAKVTAQSIPPFRPEIPLNRCDLRLLSLLKSCWAENPADRLSFWAISDRIKLIPGLRSERSLIKSVMRRLEAFSEQLEDKIAAKTAELAEEKRKNDELLFQLIPRTIVLRMQNGLSIPPEVFEEVTICFTAVANFPDILSSYFPMNIVDFLNGVFSMLDDIIRLYDVYKVESISDSYMVASGLPERNAHRHATQIAQMTLEMIWKAELPSNFGTVFGPLQLKAGLHAGSCAAAVVGTKMPRYCLFGDTINTASRMVTTGEPLKIHCSEGFATFIQLWFPKEYSCTLRGSMFVKGKGDMKTFWLNCKKE